MKKNTTIIICVAIVAILIGVAIFVFGTGTAKSNEIKLTLDNYQNYIEISGTVGHANMVEIDPIWFGRYSGSLKCVHSGFAAALDPNINTHNVASNYNFNNVKVTVKFTGKAPVVNKNTNRDNKAEITYLSYEFSETLDLMINGKPKANNKYYVPPFGANMVIVVPTISYSGLPKDYENISYTYEIIDISGTVSPA